MALWVASMDNTDVLERAIVLDEHQSCISTCVATEY